MRLALVLTAFIVGAVVTSAPAEEVCVYYDGQPGLLEAYNTMIDEIRVIAGSEESAGEISQTNDPAVMQEWLTGGEFDVALVVVSHQVVVDQWIEQAAPRTRVLAVTPDGNGDFLFTVHFFAPECSSAPLEKPDDDPGGSAADNWLEDAIQGLIESIQTLIQEKAPCWSDCLLAFVDAIPPNIEVEIEMTLKTTPPGLEVRIKFSATGAELAQLMRSQVQLLSCIAGC